MTMEPKAGPEEDLTDQEAAGAAAAPPDEIAELQAELDAAKGDLAATKERLLRTAADLENQRRRWGRERDELRARATEAPIRQFLEVVDNLDSALAAEGASADVLRTGVEMTRRQIDDVLRRFDVERMDCEGAAFDPKHHQAVSRQESAEVEQDTIVQVWQPGYMIGSRLLRPAMVVVAVPAPPEDAVAVVAAEPDAADADAGAADAGAAENGGADAAAAGGA